MSSAIRVLGGQGLTVRSSHAYIVHAGNQVTELGTVPLAPDGSFYVEVPADRAIAFQAVNAEGRSELNEMSWIYVRPGEHRACLGCHQPRQSAPNCATLPGLAMRSDPIRLLGQGRPHRFRGNNAAVTGQMELQFDRFREVAGLNRHSETADPLATSAGKCTNWSASSITAMPAKKSRPRSGWPSFATARRPRPLPGDWPTTAAKCAWRRRWPWPPAARGNRCRRYSRHWRIPIP